MNEVKAESPSTRYIIVNIRPEFQSSIHNHYKVTELHQSLEKLNGTRFFTQERALPYVTKIILTEKLF